MKADCGNPQPQDDEGHSKLVLTSIRNGRRMGEVLGHEELTTIRCLAAPAAERRKADVQAVGGESVRQRLCGEDR